MGKKWKKRKKSVLTFTAEKNKSISSSTFKYSIESNAKTCASEKTSGHSKSALKDFQKQAKAKVTISSIWYFLASLKT